MRVSVVVIPDTCLFGVGFALNSTLTDTDTDTGVEVNSTQLDCDN